MAETEGTPAEGGPSQLGGQPEGRIQRYFCIDDEECQAFSMISKEARVLRRIPKQIRLGDTSIEGWIVELMVPATDGPVRLDPHKERDGI
mgnify:CR=1 FL=1